MHRPTEILADDDPIFCRNLAVGYDGKAVVEQLTFSVAAGSTLALVGRSGCGKTTIMKTLAGILPPVQGTLRIAGTESLDRVPPGSVGYVPQGLGLVSHATVLRNVLHGTLADLGLFGSILGRFPEAAEENARQSIDQVGLANNERVRVKELSGGQRRRVAIARAFVQRPRILLADEILSELDEETAGAIVDCLDRLQTETEMAVVLVEHDLATARSIADTMCRIEDGGIAERRAPGDRGGHDA